MISNKEDIFTSCNTTVISKFTEHVPLSIKCFDLAKYMYLELCINNTCYNELDLLAIILKFIFKGFKYITQIVLYFSSLPKIIMHALLCAFLSISILILWVFYITPFFAPPAFSLWIKIALLSPSKLANWQCCYSISKSAGLIWPVHKYTHPPVITARGSSTLWQ